MRFSLIRKGNASMREQPVVAAAAFSAHAGLELRAAPLASRLLLHCTPDDAAPLGAAVGLDLPATMLRAGYLAGWDALHLAPDEWLLVGEPGAAAPLIERFAVQQSSIAHSLVDISDRNIGVEVAGPASARLLAAGCPLDLDPAAFATGSCSRTLFGKAMIMLWRTNDHPTFRIEFARSFEDYIGRLLRAAAADL